MSIAWPYIGWGALAGLALFAIWVVAAEIKRWLDREFPLD